MQGDRGFLAGDGLRAIAALSVLVFHVALDAARMHAPGGTAITTAYGGWTDALLALNTGLFVFFVLSGYFVGGRYVRAWVLDQRSPDARRFLGRRIRRVVPLLWLMGLVTLAWYGTLGSSPLEVLALFAFVQTWFPSAFEFRLGQAWTLDVEMAFYLVLPLLAAVGTRLRPRRIGANGRALLLVAGALVVAYVSLKLRVGDLNSSIGKSLPALLYAFIPGMVLAGVEPLVAPRVRALSSARVLAPGLLLVAALGVLGVMSANPVQVAERAVAGWVAATALVAAALAHQWRTDRAWRWLAHPVMVALGRWSYGIYLVHVLISYEVVQRLGGGLWTAFLAGAGLTVALSVAAAAFLWRFWERPWLTGELPWRGRTPAALAGRPVAVART